MLMRACSVAALLSLGLMLAPSLAQEPGPPPPDKPNADRRDGPAPPPRPDRPDSRPVLDEEWDGPERPPLRPGDQPGRRAREGRPRGGEVPPRGPQGGMPGGGMMGGGMGMMQPGMGPGMPGMSMDPGMMMQRDDPEMFELHMKDRRLEQQTLELAEQFRRTPADERGEIAEQLAKVVNEHFEVRQERRLLELKRLETEIDRLRKTIERRKEARDTIIKKRMSELTGERNELEF